MAKRRTRKRERAQGASRTRPKIATTVAKETFDAVKLFASERTLGSTLDRLVWCAICQRIVELHGRLCADVRPFAWRELDASADSIDRALVEILVREGRRFDALGDEEQKRLRTELGSAHETRKSMGHFSAIDDFVRLFVVMHACPSC